MTVWNHPQDAGCQKYHMESGRWFRVTKTSPKLYWLITVSYKNIWNLSLLEAVVAWQLSGKSNQSWFLILSLSVSDKTELSRASLEVCNTLSTFLYIHLYWLSQRNFFSGKLFSFLASLFFTVYHITEKSLHPLGRRNFTAFQTSSWHNSVQQIERSHVLPAQETVCFVLHSALKVVWDLTNQVFLSPECLLDAAVLLNPVAFIFLFLLSSTSW